MLRKRSRMGKSRRNFGLRSAIDIQPFVVLSNVRQVLLVGDGDTNGLGDLALEVIGL